MLVWGAQDNIVPVAAAEEYHRRIPALIQPTRMGKILN